MTEINFFNIFSICLQEIRQAAEYIDLPELLVFVSNIQSHEVFLNPELKQCYKAVSFI